jgi:hypothetical protein
VPTLTVPENQVIELVLQLSPQAKAEALRALLRDSRLEGLIDYGESRLDAEFTARGLDRSRMTPDQVEQTVLDIAEGRL